MATTHRTAARTATDHPDVRNALLTLAFVGGVVGTVAAATGAALLLATLTDGLGGFVLVAGGWLAVVSASPALAKRGTARLAEIDLAQHAPRSSRAVHAVAAHHFAR